MTALTAANARISALIHAVLVEEWPLPVSTQTIAKRVSRPYDPDVYRMLTRMEHRGDAEKIKREDDPNRYWRLAENPHAERHGP